MKRSFIVSAVIIAVILALTTAAIVFIPKMFSTRGEYDVVSDFFGENQPTDSLPTDDIFYGGKVTESFAEEITSVTESMVVTENEKNLKREDTINWILENKDTWLSLINALYFQSLPEGQQLTREVLTAEFCYYLDEDTERNITEIVTLMEEEKASKKAVHTVGGNGTTLKPGVYVIGYTDSKTVTKIYTYDEYVELFGEPEAYRIITIEEPEESEERTNVQLEDVVVESSQVVLLLREGDFVYRYAIQLNEQNEVCNIEPHA